jgi:AraC-like DNA-binding protein
MTVNTFQSLRPDFSNSALRSYTAAKFCQSDYRSDVNAAIYETSFGGVRLGAVGVFRHAGRGTFQGFRRLDHIRADHIDDYLISMPLRGSATMSQLGIDANVVPGRFVITAMVHPLHAIIHGSAAGDGCFDTFHVIVSGSLLRAQTPHIDDCCRRPINAVSGSGKIMSALFQLAIEESAELSEVECRRLDHMIVDAVANALTNERHRLPESGSRGERLVDRALHFMNSNLSDPSLSPGRIAAYCNVSVSYLHRAFALQSLKIGQVLRETRLARARESLCSPALRHEGVGEIAVRWGFPDPAHFCRAYRAHFGRSPREDRRTNG